MTQYQLGDCTSALQSDQHALDVRKKVFGEEHAKTAHSYYDIRVTEYQLGDYTFALQSHQHALDVKRKLFGEEHVSTADSYPRGSGTRNISLVTTPLLYSQTSTR